MITEMTLLNMNVVQSINCWCSDRWLCQ